MQLLYIKKLPSQYFIFFVIKLSEKYYIIQSHIVVKCSPNHKLIKINQYSQAKFTLNIYN